MHSRQQYLSNLSAKRSKISSSLKQPIQRSNVFSDLFSDISWKMECLLTNVGLSYLIKSRECSKGDVFIASEEAEKFHYLIVRECHTQMSQFRLPILCL